MAYYNSDSLNSIVLDVTKRCVPMCQPATASSMNCLVDDTADPVSEHVPKPSLNPPWDSINVRPRL